MVGHYIAGMTTKELASRYNRKKRAIQRMFAYLPDNWARLRAFGYLADNLMGVRPGAQAMQGPEDTTGRGRGESTPPLPSPLPLPPLLLLLGLGRSVCHGGSEEPPVVPRGYSATGPLPACIWFKYYG